MTSRHRTTAHWQFPASDRPKLELPLQRINLREVEARPQRFEHHLMAVASIGPVLLEVATASEPLYFAHSNVSDEYALPMTTGDAMTDSFPFRTFLSSCDDHVDVGRLNHKVNQLALHPHGFLHWPGRLRAPYAPFEFAAGMRRCGLSLVICSAAPTLPDERPLFVSAGCEAGAKQYGETPVPLLIADLLSEASRCVAKVGDCSLALVVDPQQIAPPSGGYVIVIEGDGAHFPGDLIFVPAGTILAGAGIGRAVVFSSDVTAADAPPPSWTQVPSAPFAVYEQGKPASLPLRVAGIHIAAGPDDTAIVTIGDIRDDGDDGDIGNHQAHVPRYWLARLLFRIALHEFRLGYLETYGGFYYNDAGGVVSFGVRGGAMVSVPWDSAAAVTERMYRAVAPAGYTERLD